MSFPSLPRRGLAVVALVAAAFPAAAPALAQMPPPPVTVAAPLARTITEWDEQTGRFEAVESVEVRARVSGFIEAIHFRDGDTVARGDLLFTIDQRPFQIAVDVAEAEVTRTRSQVQLAQSEVERALPLVQTRTLPQRELDTRQAQLRQAFAGLQSAQANLRNAQLNLEWTEVRAPLAGRISDRRVDVGNLIAGGTSGAQATLLTTIVRLDPIHFVFDVSEADYLKYSRLARDGTRPSGRDNMLPVRVRLSDETTFAREGRLDFVDNVVNPRAGTLRGRAVFDNKDAFLTPGLFGRLRLWAGEGEALLVPDSAIASDQARKVLLVVGANDTVEPRVVTLGPMIDGLRVIRTGLRVDDRVIINGQANPFVRPGMRVSPQPGEIKAESPATPPPTTGRAG
jgi:RND family efflux transporter MFP subunit